MKRLIIAVLLAVLAAPVFASDESVSNPFANDHNFNAPPQ
jgi:hypothetical protein